ncbi:MAG: acetyl-CoA carboxylase biotin carboxyl carrier protein [Firmicutes bacterium HGW-Firmicutes-7]|nr:MAG: acetyl-CoA carboxylase biotin carboxyl carrier protein [Firmicutes bacterium HGW-Firmicutes-7]
METGEIKELIQALKDSEYSYIEIKHEGSQIILSKEAVSVTTSKNAIAHGVEASVSTKTENIIETAVIDNDSTCHIVKSPIVGTFYSSSSPENPPFVKKGHKVKKGDTLCIIEAMKLMNEIDADVEGEVVEILICNEEVVEYNQPLFKIKVTT